MRISRAWTLVFLAGGCAASAARAGSPEFEQLVAAKNWVDAEAIAQARLAAEPASAEAAADLARVIVLAGAEERFAEAAQLLEEAVAHEPGNARHYFFLGRAYGGLAQRAGLGGLSLAGKSKAALLRAVELAPRNFEYALALNEYYLAAPFIAGGSVGRARKLALAFRSHDPDAAALLLAQVFIHEKEFQKARDQIETVAHGELLLDVTRRMLLVRLGWGLIDSGRPQPAAAVFARLVEEFPNNADCQSGLGAARLAAGDAALAVAALRRALEISDRAETWYWLGVAYQTLGDAGPARDALRIAVGRSPAASWADDARRRLARLGD